MIKSDRKAHETKDLNAFMIRVRKSYVLFRLDPIFYEIITAYRTKEQKKSQMFIDRNV